MAGGPGAAADGGGALAPEVAAAHRDAMAAYRRTLRAADAAGGWCRALLIHVVTVSSRRAGLLLLTRVDGARAIGAETGEFAAALARMDTTGRLVGRGAAFVTRPFASLESTALSVAAVSFVLYTLAVNARGSAAWLGAGASLLVFALSFSWLAVRMLRGRTAMRACLAANLDGEEARLYRAMGCDARGEPLCEVPRRVLLDVVVPAMTAATVGLALVCEGFWIGRIVSDRPSRTWVLVDVGLALVPCAVFLTAATLVRARSAMREAIRRAPVRRDWVPQAGGRLLRVWQSVPRSTSTTSSPPSRRRVTR